MKTHFILKEYNVVVTLSSKVWLLFSWVSRQPLLQQQQYLQLS